MSELKEFDVREWRQRSFLLRILILLTCRHKHTTEIAAIEHEHKGDSPVSDSWHMHALIVRKCCRCGHFSVKHHYALRDRTPGGMQRFVDHMLNGPIKYWQSGDRG